MGLCVALVVGCSGKYSCDCEYTTISDNSSGSNITKLDADTYSNAQSECELIQDDLIADNSKTGINCSVQGN